VYLASVQKNSWGIQQEMVQQCTLINGVLTVSKGGTILLDNFHIEQAVAQDRAAISDARSIAIAGEAEITDVRDISLEAPPERVTAETGVSSQPTAPLAGGAEITDVREAPPERVTAETGGSSQPSGSTSLWMHQMVAAVQTVLRTCFCTCLGHSDNDGQSQVS
jgi:hypothetical protein